MLVIKLIVEVSDSELFKNEKNREMKNLQTFSRS
jgi:hypothetical protein